MYFSLNEMIFGNNSIISISDIGNDQNNGALQCITDRKPCCRNGSDVGEWYFPFPNGSKVPIRFEAETFYRNRGFSDGAVNLHRLNSTVMSPTGLFCCQVPDANNELEMQLLCTYIGKIIKVIDHYFHTIVCLP